MNTSKTCTLKILNKSYDIKCPEAEVSNLLLAAEKLNNQIANIRKKSKHDNFHTLLLAALDISHELIVMNNQQIQVTQFINSLESKINKMVHEEIDSL